MKQIYFVFFLLFSTVINAQPNTDVFLFDLILKENVNILSEMKNISDNEGYDNQPSFMDNNTILYASTRNGQTDIVKYNINYGSKVFINHTDGSEYSPIKIPEQKAVSSIRLEKDGVQKLYKYNLRNGESEILVDEVIIGYHIWFNKNTMYSSVLEDGGLSLYRSNIDKQENHKIEAKIGRSLHNIPNSNLVSYISKKNKDSWTVNSINPVNGEIKVIAPTLKDSEDMCWLPNGNILMGQDSYIYIYDPKTNSGWIEFIDLSFSKLKNISRLAISPDGSKIAVVAEGGKEIIDTNAKLEPKLENMEWLSGNWKGEALGGVVEENWSKPSGGSMMATFKLIKDEKVVFYEIEIIREVENTLVLQLKHFNNDLKGWEAKDDTVDFPLKEITANKIIFHGMSFEKISDSEMIVSVDMRQKDGSIETLTFNYSKN